MTAIRALGMSVVLWMITVLLWLPASVFAAGENAEAINTTSNALSTSQSISSPITVDLMVGEIFEVIPAPVSHLATFAWILTQDRTFLQAARTQAFRIRKIQPGLLSLRGEVIPSQGERRVSKTIDIILHPRTGVFVTPSDTAQDPNILVTTDPAAENGTVVIADLLKLTPTSAAFKPVSIDFDTSIDTDGDGNPGNDADNQNTFFQTEGTPLYVWFINQKDRRDMRITAHRSDGTPVIQSLSVVGREYASTNNLLPAAVAVVVEERGSGSYHFTPQFTQSAPANDTLMYHWDFGDGSKSLATDPIHTFTGSGTHIVTLSVRNLLDGSTVAQTTQIMQVTDVPPSSAGGSGSEASVATGSGSSVPQEESNTTVAAHIGSFFTGTLFLVGIGLLALLLILLLFVLLIRKFLKRAGSLEDTFANLEQKIVDVKPSAPPPLTITPKAISNQTPVTPSSVQPPAPAQRPAQSQAPTPPFPVPAPVPPPPAQRELNQTPFNPKPDAEPKIQEAAAPPWLKQGLGAAPATIVSPPSSPLATSLTPPNTPKPSIAPPVMPTPSTPSQQPDNPPFPPVTPVPSWLQKPASTQKPATPPTVPAAPAPLAVPSFPPPPTTPPPLPAVRPVSPPPFSPPLPPQPKIDALPPVTPAPVLPTPATPSRSPPPSPSTVSSPQSQPLAPAAAPIAPQPSAPLPAKIQPPATSVAPAAAPISPQPSRHMPVNDKQPAQSKPPSPAPTQRPAPPSPNMQKQASPRPTSQGSPPARGNTPSNQPTKPVQPGPNTQAAQPKTPDVPPRTNVPPAPSKPLSQSPTPPIAPNKPAVTPPPQSPAKTVSITPQTFARPQPAVPPPSPPLPLVPTPTTPAEKPAPQLPDNDAPVAIIRADGVTE